MQDSKSTNTLIISRIGDKTDEIVLHVEKVILKELPNETVKVVVLKQLKRIILIFKDVVVAHTAVKFLKSPDYTIGFSKMSTSTDGNDKDAYLQLPSNTRMFLISPPASPPSEFDYEKVEEEPNTNQSYTIHDLKQLNNHHDVDTKQLESIILNNSTGTPKIVLHPVNGEDNSIISEEIKKFRTALPPKSVFDDI